MDTAQMARAVTPEVQALVHAAPPYRTIDPLRYSAALRAQGYAADVVAEVLTQARLRERARDKFGEFADGMVFTEAGLEQATRLQVAARHAERYVAAEATRVADLTAGIGADAMALSAAGLRVMAFELDEATAMAADYNLRHWPDSVVVHADSIATVRECDVDAVFADPARRNARGRTHDSRDYTPPLDAVLALRGAFPALGVKVGPAIPHAELPPGVEAEWVSVDGDVVEAALWCGPLAHDAGRGATVIVGSQTIAVRDTGATVDAGAVGTFLHEPDGAVIRAGLVAELAAPLAARLLDPTIAYLTSDAATSHPAARSYAVLEVMPYSVKRLKQFVRANGIGRLDIKKRGIDVTPERLRPQLSLRGDAHATVVLTRVAGAHTAIVVRPLPRVEP